MSALNLRSAIRKISCSPARAVFVSSRRASGTLVWRWADYSTTILAARAHPLRLRALSGAPADPSGVEPVGAALRRATALRPAFPGGLRQTGGRLRHGEAGSRRSRLAGCAQPGAAQPRRICDARVRLKCKRLFNIIDMTPQDIL